MFIPDPGSWIRILTYSHAWCYKIVPYWQYFLNHITYHQCFGSVFIFYGSGSGSSGSGWRPIRIRIRIRIQSGSRALMTKNWRRKKIKLKKNWFFLNQKLQFTYLSLGLHKERPSYRRSLQISKGAIQHFKTWTLFLLSCVIFPNPDPDTLTRLNPDPDPDPQPWAEEFRDT